MIKEFKEFAMKGNMLDMAVGIVIGAAFGTMVKSLVDDIIMPVVSGIFRIPDFSNLFVVINQQVEGVDYTAVEAAREAGEAVFAYGLFINAIIAFLLVAWALFFVIKAMNKMKKKEPKEEAPKGPSELDVLMEIRDSLKRN
jgi:large conductance mechanosensitive channel